MLIEKFVAVFVTFCLMACPTPVTSEQTATTTMQTVHSTIATTTPEMIVDLVYKNADKYKVSAERMLKTMKCENHGFDPKQQSGLRYKYDNVKWGVKAGEREKSFGLSMIHLPDHPDISYEQATDATFAIEFMAKSFAQGQQNMWTCYRDIYGIE